MNGSALGKAVASTAGILAPLRGTYNEDAGEWDELRYGPIPFWKRDKNGKPRLFGIPFPRLRKARNAAAK